MLKKLSIILMSTLLCLILATSVFAYNEAPMLKEQVDKGELPSVEERLPEEPLVVEPINEIGVYGGTWRDLETHDFNYKLWDGMQKYTRDYTTIPNIAKEIEANDDYTKFTIHLRKGMKWSDGEPFDTEDLMFFFEDILFNDKLRPSIATTFKAGGEVVKVSAPDEYTLVMEYAAPKPTLEPLTAEIWQSDLGPRLCRAPKHYLKQFHPTYADADELAAKVKESGMDSWHQLLINKSDLQKNAETPTLQAWKLVSDPKDNIQEAVRNPYYWKVDTEGNQLPYIDKIVWQDINDPEIKAMKAMGGEIDLMIGLNTSQFPVLKSSEADGNYRTLRLNATGLSGAAVVQFFNQSYDGDPDIAELLKNKKFRQAISVGINRAELNEFIALGLAEERQSVVADKYPAGNPEYSKRYTEYDPEKANQWLDEAGLDQRDNDGWRKLPNGEKLQLILNPSGVKTRSTDAATILAEQYRKLGLNASSKPEERSLWVERSHAGKHMMPVYANSNGARVWSDPNPYFPIEYSCYWAPLYGRYYSTDGEGGMKPDATTQKLQDMYDEISVSVDEEFVMNKISEAMDLHSEELFMVGIIGYPPWPVVAHNRMKNIPENFDLTGKNPYPIYPSQFYIDPDVSK